MERFNRKLFWSLALTGLLIDQVSKYGLFSYLANVENNRLTVIPGAFVFVAQFEDGKPYVNHGALFGLGQQYEGASNLLFAVISCLAAVAIIYWSCQPSTARDRPLCIALGLILAGTLGNLYDRLVFGGVRDFMHWYYLVDWPVFNWADCSLVAGAGLLLWMAFRSQPAAQEGRPTNPLLSVREGRVAPMERAS